MIIHHRSTRTRHGIGGLRAAAAMLALAVAVPAFAAPTSLPGSHVVVSTTTTYDGLVIPDGQVITAPEGKVLVMTVDGVHTAMRSGTYSGKVVLSVVDPMVVKYHDVPPAPFHAAVFVDGGKVVPSRSALAAVSAGTAADGEARDVRIVSRDDMLNGFIITGDGRYVIDNPVLDMVGNGGNDFAGYGAAIMTTGNADVTINNPKIRTKGAVRTAIFVGGNSVVHVNNADIYTESGTLPPDYQETLKVGWMKEVPWQLSLSGNVRATNLVDHGTVYYTNCHVRTSGWGALSVDDAAVVRMFVKDSLIETIESGYGAYSIGDSIDTFDHSTLNVADYGLIIAGRGGGVFTNGTIVNSRRFGVMLFDHDGGGDLRIEKGTTFNTRFTTILFKGRGGRVTIDDAHLNPGNGVILQAMIEDNPRKVEQKLAAERAAAAAAAAPQGQQPIVGERTVNPMGRDVSFDVTANIRNAVLTGDFLNTRTNEGGLILNFAGSTISGALSTGTQQPIGGAAPVKATYWQIGEVIDTLAPTPAKNGLSVKLDGGSRWVVTRTSYLTTLSIAKGARVEAPDGYKLTLTRDGKAVPIRAGSYSGALTLTVVPLSRG